MDFKKARMLCRDKAEVTVATRTHIKKHSDYEYRMSIGWTSHPVIRFHHDGSYTLEGCPDYAYIAKAYQLHTPIQVVYLPGMRATPLMKTGTGKFYPIEAGMRINSRGNPVNKKLREVSPDALKAARKVLMRIANRYDSQLHEDIKKELTAGNSPDKLTCRACEVEFHKIDITKGTLPITTHLHLLSHLRDRTTSVSTLKLLMCTTYRTTSKEVVNTWARQQSVATLSATYRSYAWKQASHYVRRFVIDLTYLMNNKRKAD